MPLPLGGNLKIARCQTWLPVAPGDLTMRVLYCRRCGYPVAWAADGIDLDPRGVAHEHPTEGRHVDVAVLDFPAMLPPQAFAGLRQALAARLGVALASIPGETPGPAEASGVDMARIP